MSDLWVKNLQKGMLVRIMSSLEKELIGKLGVVKEVTIHSPRTQRRMTLAGEPIIEVEVLVQFPDIEARPEPTVMVQRGNQFGKSHASVDWGAKFYYEKIFRPEHIAPASTMDRLLYG